MKKQEQKPVTVVNINRHGQVFNPSEYLVRRDENPELYRFLERKESKQ